MHQMAIPPIVTAALTNSKLYETLVPIIGIGIDIELTD
jgi:hypothetical protein